MTSVVDLTSEGCSKRKKEREKKVLRQGCFAFVVGGWKGRKCIPE
jgi:hypothetical protein